MRVLLDTSAYSAFFRGHQEVKTYVQKAHDLALTPIILGELRAGFLRGRRTQKNEDELEAFLSSPRVRVLALDEETAHRYAVILNALWKAGTPIPTNNIWIAASAMQYGLELLTTDAHFQQVQSIIVHVVPPLPSLS